MARTKGKTSSDKLHSDGQRSAGTKWQQPEWFNPYLDQTDLDWLESHLDEQQHFVVEFLLLIPQSARFSLKFDGNSGRWLAYVMFAADDEVNPNRAISVRGATAADAIFALGYSLAVKYEWELPEASDAPKSRFG